jgi:hypothetical protein
LLYISIPNAQLSNNPLPEKIANPIFGQQSRPSSGVQLSQQSAGGKTILSDKAIDGQHRPLDLPLPVQ